MKKFKEEKRAKVWYEDLCVMVEKSKDLFGICFENQLSNQLESELYGQLENKLYGQLDSQPFDKD